MPHFTALTFNVLSFAIIVLAVVTETSLQSLEPGYRCGNEFYGEKYLETVKQASASVTEYRGHIKFDEDVFKVPIPDPESPQYPCYIIVDRDNEIVSVISPRLVDSSVDDNEDSRHELNNPNRPETFTHYRKCEQRPSLSSISGPYGGFDCGIKTIKAQEAIKAAQLARKMYKKKKSSWRTMFNPYLYPRRHFTISLDGNFLKYTLPITTEARFKKDGQISVILDSNFNVVGAMSHVARKNTYCTVLTELPPELLTCSTSERELGIDGYKCNPGYSNVVEILILAWEARNLFEAKEDNPEKPYPRLYTGALFPDVSETLYYVPLHSKSLRKFSRYLVLTRSCDIVGVLQKFSNKFRKCEERFNSQAPGCPSFHVSFLSSA